MENLQRGLAKDAFTSNVRQMVSPEPSPEPEPPPEPEPQMQNTKIRDARLFLGAAVSIFFSLQGIWILQHPQNLDSIFRYFRWLSHGTLYLAVGAVGCSLELSEHFWLVADAFGRTSANHGQTGALYLWVGCYTIGGIGDPEMPTAYDWKVFVFALGVSCFFVSAVDFLAYAACIDCSTRRIELVQEESQEKPLNVLDLDDGCMMELVDELDVVCVGEAVDFKLEPVPQVPKEQFDTLTLELQSQVRPEEHQPLRGHFEAEGANEPVATSADDESEQLRQTIQMVTAERDFLTAEHQRLKAAQVAAAAAPTFVEVAPQVPTIVEAAGTPIDASATSWTAGGTVYSVGETVEVYSRGASAWLQAQVVKVAQTGTVTVKRRCSTGQCQMKRVEPPDYATFLRHIDVLSRWNDWHEGHTIAVARELRKSWRNVRGSTLEPPKSFAKVPDENGAVADGMVKSSAYTGFKINLLGRKEASERGKAAAHKAEEEEDKDDDDDEKESEDSEDKGKASVSGPRRPFLAGRRGFGRKF